MALLLPTSPDGSSLGLLTLWNIGGQSALPVPAATPFDVSVAWLPGGKCLLTVGSHKSQAKIYLVDADTGKAVPWSRDLDSCVAYVRPSANQGRGAAILVAQPKQSALVSKVSDASYNYSIADIAPGKIGAFRPVDASAVDRLVGPAYRKALALYRNRLGTDYRNLYGGKNLLLSPDGKAALIQGDDEMTGPEWARSVTYVNAHLLLPDGRVKRYREPVKTAIRFTNWSRDGRFLYGQRGLAKPLPPYPLPLVGLDTRTGRLHTLLNYRVTRNTEDGGEVAYIERFIEDGI